MAATKIAAAEIIRNIAYLEDKAAQNPQSALDEVVRILEQSKSDFSYSLLKEDSGEYPYKDQDGVSWDTPTAWLFIGILGGCGCGQSDEFGHKALRLLRFFASPHQERTATPFEEDEAFHELMAHWFDAADLIEHGSILTTAWLTNKGRQILEIIDRLEAAH